MIHLFGSNEWTSFVLDFLSYTALTVMFRVLLRLRRIKQRFFTGIVKIPTLLPKGQRGSYGYLGIALSYPGAPWCFGGYPSVYSLVSAQ